MPHHRSQIAVTKFLRDALAVDAMGVAELEATARAAGLLGERQQISHARLFKRAKASLAIKSLRTGFGARSQWLWQLPRHKDDQEQDAAPQRRLPIDWVEGVAR